VLSVLLLFGAVGVAAGAVQSLNIWRIAKGEEDKELADVAGTIAALCFFISYVLVWSAGWLWRTESFF